MPQPNTFLELFSEPADDNWTFSGHTSYNHLTHGYHRYPAKFVPLLVKKLIEEYTQKNDKVVDMFAGCGTTLVESKVHGRESIGVDVNPIARLITKAKITAIPSHKLDAASDMLFERLKGYKANTIYFFDSPPRIDYWFREEEKNKIAFLYRTVCDISNRNLRTFYLCALSNILKTCSRWLQSSTKPQVDPDRDNNIPDPFNIFKFQIKRMSKKNKEFYHTLAGAKNLRTKCEIKIADARRTGIEENSVGALITSPPYVTSYEYADIHQLTGYWFDYISEISSFRKKFIGTFYSNNKDKNIKAPIAKLIVSKLEKRSTKHAKEVAKYFNDMFEVSKEMHRILKLGGMACIVMGNTTLRNVEIESAQAFTEMLFMNGFEISKVIKRQITSKQIPTIRDKTTGRFATLEDANSKKVYPEEYIIVARKKHARIQSS
jgi:DNA modification methylase